MPPTAISALLFAEGIAPRISDQQLWTYGGLGLCLLAGLIYLGVKLKQLPHESRAKLNPTLDPMQVEELMQGTPPIIVDLRTPEAFHGKHGHLRGAMNIPFPELKNRMDEIRGTTGNRPIVLVDNDDRLSHLVVPILRYEGFAWFYVMKGGMKAWTALRLPVYR